LTIANVSGTGGAKSRRTICDFFLKKRQRFCGTKGAKGVSSMSVIGVDDDALVLADGVTFDTFLANAASREKRQDDPDAGGSATRRTSPCPGVARSPTTTSAVAAELRAETGASARRGRDWFVYTPYSPVKR
jgi:hypothetical protein